jgi:hypothetical protein
MVFTCFYHQISGFPVNFPIIQFYEWGISWGFLGDLGGNYPLVNIKKKLWKITIYSGFTHEKW